MSRFNNFKLDISCLVLPEITMKLPLQSFDKQLLNLPSTLQLADPELNVSSKIDILLGISAVYKILCMKQISKPNQPVLQKTKLGWVVAGNLRCNNDPSQVISCHSISSRQIDENLTKFWELEKCGNFKSSISNDYCESHFMKTHTRDHTGRFIVEIPFKNNLGDLGNSRDYALQRFLSLEARLDKNVCLKTDYSQFMNEYEQLGHMTRINDFQDDNRLQYFLPHHAVIKNSSITTKLRVVFDASAKTDSGLSLNEVQYIGPTIQNDLFSILMRFRQHKYVITADISKMYRQVLINPNQRRFQRILWRGESDQEIQCYELNTVTYGTSSAPFFAVRCLFQLGLDNVIRFPKASQIIMKDFYMDDLLTGANTINELIQLQHEVTSILSSGGFDLRKWLSNHPDISNNFLVKDDLESSILSMGELDQNKTLGIIWNSSLDTIQYSIKHVQIPIRLTKRHILSTTAQILDPLGLLGPIVIVAKLMLQLLWQEQLTWDDPVPESISKKWHTFCKNFKILNTLTMPRYVLNPNAVDIELHAFADASQVAYGTCVYLRCKLDNGSYESKLLCAKSRVAPIKTTTLPRLELCAALLLAHLVFKVKNSMSITISRHFYWSDSKIALCWIKSEPNKWKTFVANRVSEIQELTNINDWHHVNSSNNSADLLSRGATSEQLIQSQLWWHGPSFLRQDRAGWELPNDDNECTAAPEQRVSCNINTTSFLNFDLFSKFSSLVKLQRVFAYCARFISNAQVPRKLRNLGSLTTSELNRALEGLIRISQIQAFERDYYALKNNTGLSKRSTILSLNPFIDNEGIIRVGGRLQNADVSYNKKHPILLHNKHVLTRLLMEQYHIKLLHCGPQQLLYAIREQYWPISGRSLTRKIVRGCVICFKSNPTQSQYIMGNLPFARVNQCYPFVNTGVDYAGPLLLKDRKTRRAKLIKAYICIFICMATKAIHLELVTDLTTEAFLATLKRFIARRGKPSNIYSDNGTTFVGADSSLSKTINSSSVEIETNLANEGITWHFIPPRAPNFGGLWEAGVKSVKTHLKRIFGNAHLTYEEFSTALCQIEGVLNSRPLCPLSTSPQDDLPLTPGHFLIGRSIMSLPEENLTDVPEARLSKFQRLQQLMQHFWHRWQREYISELQARSKWRTDSMQSIQLNNLVIVKEDNLPPGQWRLGRVVKLHPGSDEVVRVVTIKCSGSEIKRSLTRVCRLPVNQTLDVN